MKGKRGVGPLLLMLLLLLLPLFFSLPVLAFLAATGSLNIGALFSGGTHYPVPTTHGYMEGRIGGQRTRMCEKEFRRFSRNLVFYVRCRGCLGGELAQW